MKYLFSALILIMIGASILTGLSLPNSQSDVPVIYWVTGINSARVEQVRLFHRWMLSEGHSKEFTLDNASAAQRFIRRNIDLLRQVAEPQLQPQGDALEQLLVAYDKKQPVPDSIHFPVKVALPVVRLALDATSRNVSKQVIQGVSGVAADIQDVYGSSLRYFHEIGLAHDVTQWGKQMQFDPSRTYPAVLTDMTIADDKDQLHQYLFPCNVAVAAYIVNNDAFKQWGQPLPPKSWTIEEFERRGKAFVEAANKDRKRQVVFFADAVPNIIVRASFGGARFNETNTACILNSPASIKTMQLGRKWMFVDHLVPTDADRSGFSSDASAANLMTQLFMNNEQPEQGQVAMIFTGRHAFTELRKYNQARKDRGLAAIEYGITTVPSGGFENTYVTIRGAMIYEGSPHKELAKYFLAFLASKPYSMQIVEDSDALPPDPQATHTEEYLHPKDYPNEWQVHKGFADMAVSIAIPASNSPFILSSSADRIEKSCLDKFMQPTPLEGYETAEKTGAIMVRMIEDEIQRTLKENPDLRPQYDKLVARQKQIDALKAQIVAFEAEHAGEPVPEQMQIPLKWIENPFYRAYYAHKGWVK